ncbi:fasciclin domain-containing protein [Phormidesmis sp. 146-12]
MKNSFKKLASTIGVLGFSLAVALPTFAQSASPSSGSTGRDSNVNSTPNEPSQLNPSSGSEAPAARPQPNVPNDQTNPGGINTPANRPQAPGGLDAPTNTSPNNTTPGSSSDQTNPGGINTPANRPQAPGGLDAPTNTSPNNTTPESPVQRPVPSPGSPQGIVVPSSSSSQTLDAIVRQSPSFELFNALLRVADQNGALSTVLNGSSSYTVFAPTDEALAALPQGTFKALVQPENRDLLVRILENHIVRGKVLSNEVGSRELRSLIGEPIALTSAPVVGADIQTSNGVIHAINGVILPADVQSRLVGLVPQPISGSTIR